MTNALAISKNEEIQKYVDEGDYIALNSMLGLIEKTPDGRQQYQLDKEKLAVEAYLNSYVLPNMKNFDSYVERVEYLVQEKYYSPLVFEQYSHEFIELIRKRMEDSKFEFKSFIGAYKFYRQYALKSRESNLDSPVFLEDYKDRATIVALYLAQGDENLAINIAQQIIEGKFQPATPTYLNAGRDNAGELVSCFLLLASDNMESIAQTSTRSLQLSKRGGGVGVLLTNLREVSAPIKGFNGLASGVVPVMKILEDDFSYADQLGQRQGAGAVYISAHHPDIMRVLDTKRENADEKIRIKTLSVGVVITDALMEAAKNGEDYYLFSPLDVKKEYGKSLTSISITDEYNNLINNKNIKKTVLSARKFLMTVAELQFESGYPYIMFEDQANRRNNIHGRINMSNLCYTGDTEVLTDKGYVKAIDLYHSGEEIKVVVDKRALNMDLKETGTSVEQATKMYKTAENADVYKVTTVEGMEIKATKWHKFYVSRENKIVKIPLSELVVGDKLLVQGEASECKGENNSDLAYISGVIAADGSIAVNKKTGNQIAKLYLYEDKDIFKNKISNSINRILKNRDELCNRQATTNPKWVKSKNKNLFTMTSTPLATVLNEFGINKENKISVPQFVKNGNLDTKRSFIDGVWSMDGCITGSAERHIHSAEMSSINKSFLLDMQKILLELNIFSRIYKVREPSSVSFKKDGKRYSTKEIWSLRVTTKEGVKKLNSIVDWKESSQKKYREIFSNESFKSWNQHNFCARVESIEFAGKEDVYDITVDNGHSQIANGIVTGNCSEILQVNSETIYDENNEGQFIEQGRDISCNLGSMNIAKVMEKDNDFATTVSTAIRSLTSVSDNTNLGIVASVKNGNDKSHSVGLGAMNLHGFLGANKIEYGSDESLDFVNAFFATTRFFALKESMKIAKERKETFYEFDKSLYAKTNYEGRSIALENYTSGTWRTTPQTQKIKELFEERDFWTPSVQDWINLDSDIREYGLYNAYLMAVAPTGSISYVNNSTASVHPIVSQVETRKEGKLGRVYVGSPHMTNENRMYFKDAYQLGYKAIVDVYSVAQKHVDQGMSLTLFYNSDATTRDMNRAYIYAWSRDRVKNENGKLAIEDPETSWKSGFIKTLYYARIKQQALAGTTSDECVSCLI